MSRRLVLIVAPAIAAVAAGAGGLAISSESEPKPDPLLVSGAQRYEAYVRAERDSMRSMVAAGDQEAARIHRERLRPASEAAGLSDSTPGPVEVVSAASSILSLDGRRVGEVALLDVESHAAGSGVAFDGIRDALWARDKGLGRSSDERVAGVRTEIGRHRRGEGLRAAGSLSPAHRPRPRAALDALASRPRTAADRLSQT